MTTTEVIDQLLAADPSRSYCATKEAWRTRLQREGADRHFTYRVAMLPGVYGAECSQWEDREGFDKPLARALQELENKNIPATPNDE